MQTQTLQRMRGMRRFGALGRAGVSILAACCCALASGACLSSMYYHPDARTYFTPQELGFHYQEFTLETADGQSLKAWRIPAKRPHATIIQFHGNAQNMSAHFASLVWLVNFGFNLITFDYRGYGASTGEPDPAGLHADALRALRFAQNTVLQDRTPLIVYGQSLGGAVALRAVPEMRGLPRPAAVVIEGSFASYRAVGAEKMDQWCFPPVPKMLSHLLDERYSPRESVARIAPLPLIIVHGTHDGIVPFHHGQEIYRLARQPRVLLTMRGAGHLFWNQPAATKLRPKFARLLKGVAAGGDLNPLVLEFLTSGAGAAKPPTPTPSKAE